MSSSQASESAAKGEAGKFNPKMFTAAWDVNPVAKAAATVTRARSASPEKSITTTARYMGYCIGEINALGAMKGIDDVTPTPTDATFAGTKVKDIKPFKSTITYGGPMTHYEARSAKQSYLMLKHQQSFFPPQFCVLVGNLPNNFSDMLLTAFIEKEFGEYGDCWACVFRNKRKEEDSPHAIVQYTTEQDAAAAYHCGRGKGLGKRVFRVEPSSRAPYVPYR